MDANRVACVALLWHALLLNSACQTSPQPQHEQNLASAVSSASAANAANAAPRGREEANSYRALLAKLDGGVAHARAALETAHPSNWLVREHLAALLLERAQLTGRVEDYREVQTVLDDAFGMAPRGSGPVLLAARFNVSIHRLDEAEGHLATIAEQAVVTRETKIGAHRIAAQIAFSRGEYAEAHAGLEQIAAASPALVRTELAIYHAATGATAKAEGLFGQALAAAKPADPRLRAWTRLQLGILAMQTGRYEQALDTLREADAELPGWWLIEEHIAEVYTLLGRDQDAVPLYEKVVRDTELPQYQGALAAVYERLNRHEEASELVARAGAAWDGQLAVLPESAMGHGLEFFLEHGTPEKALALAQQNYDVRPGGEAQIGLARAYLKAGQPAAAALLLERTLKTPYRSADLHDVARQAYAAVGRADAAEAQRASCLALNPRYAD
jgi:thioredoxin-like negative regulator of GroEL